MGSPPHSIPTPDLPLDALPTLLPTLQGEPSRHLRAVGDKFAEMRAELDEAPPMLRRTDCSSAVDNMTGNRLYKDPTCKRIIDALRDVYQQEDW